MKVSIIIVNYNTVDLLRECIASIKIQTQNIAYEIIVVDNNSSDGSAEMVGKIFPEVILLSSAVNLGFGRANNLGAQKATGEYLFFLNSDTALLNNAAFLLADFLDKNASCGICGGNLTDQSNTPIHSFSPNLPSPFSDLYRFYPAALPFYNFTASPLQVGYITGADLMIRKNVFDILHGFDRDFFMYYEETELTSRVKKAGYSVYSVPAARITHIKGASLEFLTGAKKMVFESKYRYLLKVYGKRSALIAHMIFMLYCQCKRSAFALLGKTKKYRIYTRMLQMDKNTYLQEIRNI